MLCSDSAYGQARAARGFGGHRAYRGDPDSSEGVGDIDAERLRAFEQSADGVGAGEQKPVEGAHIAKRFIERSKIAWRMKRDHGLEDGLGAASFEFANERFGLIGCA